MKKALLSLSLFGLLGLAATASAADLTAPIPVVVVPPVTIIGGLFPPVVLQLGPTTSYSTINCAEFSKEPNGTWMSTGSEPFGLGFVQGIIPPARPIKAGGFIYNNIDLYSQLEEQCVGAVVKARY